MKFDFSHLNPGPTNWLSDIFKKLGEKRRAEKAFEVKLAEVVNAIAGKDAAQVALRLQEAGDFGMLTPRHLDLLLLKAIKADDLPTFNAIMEKRGEPNALMSIEHSPTVASYQHILYAAIDYRAEKIATDLANRADISYTVSGVVLMGAEGERKSPCPKPLDAAEAKGMTGVVEILRARETADAKNDSLLRLARSLMNG